ncbi:unnamed protein product [Paramecium octaurelia]|uniref:Uncharacterized protein n=1 Tax=Paramecium octaurelia TaxID=43137 RepID=A0A8S1V9L9_PAROT|nr:unnamed protein product [Paramecium octaurelia]
MTGSFFFENSQEQAHGRSSHWRIEDLVVGDEDFEVLLETGLGNLEDFSPFGNLLFWRQEGLK